MAPLLLLGQASVSVNLNVLPDVLLSYFVSLLVVELCD